MSAKKDFLKQRKKHPLDSFPLAMEITKIYAATANADAYKIPTLLVDLFLLFEYGEHPNLSRESEH